MPIKTMTDMSVAEYESIVSGRTLDTDVSNALTPRKKKKSQSKKAQVKRSQGQPYAKAVRQSNGFQSVTKNMEDQRLYEMRKKYLQSLRLGTANLSTNATGMNGTMAGVRGPVKGATPYLKKQLTGRPTSLEELSTPRVNSSYVVPGTPSYKSQEDMYDEIIDLKKDLVNSDNMNSTLKSRCRRIEEENLKKDKQIASLLDPGKCDEIRRTIGEKKADSAAVINSLKHKILQLEIQVKDKEYSLRQFNDDLKTTKVEEMRTAMQTFYQEVLRLRAFCQAGDPLKGSGQRQNNVSADAAKMKALSLTIKRLSETTQRLEAENRTLKEDLHNAIEPARTPSNNEFQDMNRKQLLDNIADMEQKLSRYERITQDEKDPDMLEVKGKIDVSGLSVADRLELLSKRENELLLEIEKLKGVNQKLRDDRVYYRKQLDEKELLIKNIDKDGYSQRSRESKEKYEDDSYYGEDYDEAVVNLQAALRGHATRNEKLQQFRSRYQTPRQDDDTDSLVSMKTRAGKSESRMSAFSADSPPPSARRVTETPPTSGRKSVSLAIEDDSDDTVTKYRPLKVKSSKSSSLFASLKRGKVTRKDLDDDDSVGFGRKVNELF